MTKDGLVNTNIGDLKLEFPGIRTMLEQLLPHMKVHVSLHEFLGSGVEEPLLPCLASGGWF